jgi:Ca2+-binding RTX toxin-like protein
MIGGDGNDTYFANATTDVVREEGGGSSGIDTVNFTSATIGQTYTLSNDATFGFIENLTLGGTARINGVGNDQNNILTGNGANNSLTAGAGDDTILGGGGVDTISGGLGHDTLTGGAGNDVFIYTNADFGGATGQATDHSDVILDYTAGDKINLKGLISLAEAGVNANSVLDFVHNLDGTWGVQLKNENAVLQNGHGGPSVILTVTSATNIVFSLNDHDWTYNIGTDTFA